VFCVLGLDGIGLHVSIASLFVDVVGVFDLGLMTLGLHVGIRVAHGDCYPTE
jgi:hypothetical protein